MNVFHTEDIRNVSLFGHAGSGKTMITESLMLRTGVINRMGSIESNNTISDSHELEHEKGHSFFSTLLSAEWHKKKINHFDNPGYDDFIGEAAASITVSENAVAVINANHGIEIGADLGWELAEKQGKATSILLNHMDESDIDFESLIEDLKNHWGNNVTVVHYPVSTGSGFNSIINLISGKQYTFLDGKCEVTEIDDSLKDKAAELRGELVESIAESDEDLMNQYFEEGDLSADQLRDGLRKAMIGREIFPVMVYSAKNNVGADAFLDAVANYFPSPADAKTILAEDGREIPCDKDAPVSLLNFKMFADPRQGDVTFFKVYSGTVKHSQDLVNTSNNHPERINQMFIFNGNKKTDVQELQAGDIGATVKLKHTHINETLAQKGLEVKIPSISYPQPKVRIAIEAKNKGEEEKLGTSLNHLHEEDPSLLIEHSKELKQIILFAQGDQHLSVAKWRLENRYKVDVLFTEPRVPYRETIQRQAKGDYRHKKQSGGAGQFAEVHLMIEPWYDGIPDPSGVSVRGKELIDLPWGGKLEFINSIVGGVIDQRFLPAILKGIMEKMENGPLTGSYVRDVRVVVYDGKMHPVDSNESAFKTAGTMAFKSTFKDASPQLMEPVYLVKIKVPEDYVGDIMSDLPSRRGIIMGIDTEGSNQIINAKMPLMELDKYASSLRSLTQAKGTFTSQFEAYESVPQNVQQELINKHASHDDEE